MPYISQALKLFFKSEDLNAQMSMHLISKRRRAFKRYINNIVVALVTKLH